METKKRARVHVHYHQIALLKAQIVQCSVYFYSTTATFPEYCTITRLCALTINKFYYRVTRLIEGQLQFLVLSDHSITQVLTTHFVTKATPIHLFN